MSNGKATLGVENRESMGNAEDNDPPPQEEEGTGRGGD